MRFTRRTRAFAANLVPLVVWGAFATPARAQTKTECVEAFARAQSLRNELKLRASLTEFSSCARDACPGPVRADCAAGLEQVTRDLPTVILGARDAAGRDVADAAIFVDGTAVAPDERGATVSLDPGPHTFRVEHPDFVSAEERVVIRAGERNRSLVVTLARKDGDGAPAPSPPNASDNSAPQRKVEPGLQPDPGAERSDNRRTAAYIVGGAGLAAFAVGAGLGISAIARCGGLLHEPCDAVAEAPLAEQNATRRSIYTQEWVANVTIGLGVVGVGVVAVLLLWPSPAGKSAARSLSRAHVGGGGFGLGASF
jgi:hypothetical protein